MIARHAQPQIRATFPAEPPMVMVTISLRLLRGDLYASTDVAVHTAGRPDAAAAGRDEAQALVGQALRGPVRSAIRALVEALGGDLTDPPSSTGA